MKFPFRKRNKIQEEEEGTLVHAVILDNQCLMADVESWNLGRGPSRRIHHLYLGTSTDTILRDSARMLNKGSIWCYGGHIKNWFIV